MYLYDCELFTHYLFSLFEHFSEAALEIFLPLQSFCWKVSGLELCSQLDNSEIVDTAFFLVKPAIPQDTNKIQVAKNLVQIVSC